MSWQKLLDDNKVRHHRTSPREISDLLAVVDRDLADAAIGSLSADRRFATAYNAALQAAKICIACQGYRVVGTGHHAVTFDAVALILGPETRNLIAYFDACRRKRNQVDYDVADLISESEAGQLLERAREMRGIAVEFVRLNHPQLLEP